LTHGGLFFFQVLGTPTRDEIKRMNPNYTEFKFPQIKAHPWHKVKATYFSFFSFGLMMNVFLYYYIYTVKYNDSYFSPDLPQKNAI
jgi:hypothetical protein